MRASTSNWAALSSTVLYIREPATPPARALRASYMKEIRGIRSLIFAVTARTDTMGALISHPASQDDQIPYIQWPN